MAYEDYVEEITIEGVEDLFDYITGRKNIPDLREDFIFRGVKSSEHELIPSSLRKDDDGEFKIDKYLKGEFLDNRVLKENIVLFDFLEMADKQGFKIPIPQKFREFFHKYVKSDRDYVLEPWPTYDYFEAISLAQHYGIPTCALDWSYDYKVALYFSVIGVLEDKHKDDDCVLWAFNHKTFESSRDSIKNFKDVKLWINRNIPAVSYRPAYNDNPNLNAQKGLFTFVIQKPSDYSGKSLDQVISDELDACMKNEGNEVTIFEKNSGHRITLKEDEKVFYKFIIPQDLKAEILNDLYKDGYTEERIFPGYDSIAKSIENKIKLDEELKRK